MSEYEAPQQRSAQATRPLRILVENSEYWLRNNGDLAMLTVTLDRIHKRWPQTRADRRTYRLPMPTSCLFPSRRRNLGLRRESPGAAHAARAPGRTPRPLGWWDRSPWPDSAYASDAGSCRTVCGPAAEVAAVGTTAPRARRRPRQRNRAAAHGPSACRERGRRGAVVASGGARRRVPHGRR